MPPPPEPTAAASSSSVRCLAPAAAQSLAQGTHVPPRPGQRPAPARGPSAGTGTGDTRGQGCPPQLPPYSRLGDDVSVGQRRALHTAYPDGAQDVAETSAQVPPADGQQGAPLQRSTQRLNLQERSLENHQEASGLHP